MQRVLVLGCCGAGKSTFSRRLARQTGLPHIELDSHYWRAGWERTPRAEFFPIVEKFCSEQTWIIDGNYQGSLHIRLPHADTVIYLDYPRRISMWRVLKRLIKGFGRVRSRMAENCPERIDFQFLRYVWDYNRLYRPKILANLQEDGGHVHLHIMRSPNDAEVFLASLSQNTPSDLPQPAPNRPEPAQKSD